MTTADLDGFEGYGDWENILHIKHVQKLSNDDQKAYVKKLWRENPEQYNEWKSLCIELDQLPELFGTLENPIPIDESKL